MTRRGCGPDPEEPDADRGNYPTWCSVALLLRRRDTVFVLRAGEAAAAAAAAGDEAPRARYSLPGRAVHEDEGMHLAAERLAGMCGAAPTGVMGVQHHLELEGAARPAAQSAPRSLQYKRALAYSSRYGIR